MCRVPEFRPQAVLGVTALSLVALLAVRLNGQTQAPPVFRATVDRIAVDVEVVDRTGHPVVGLGPNQFTVMIDGRRRRVVTADLIRYGSAANTLATEASGTSEAGGPARPTGRVIMIAVDCLSFNVATSRGIITAAREFVRRLLPDDRVGLLAFPIGPRIEPTTNHVAVSLAMDKIVGQRDPPAVDRFNLRPSELIDLSLWVDGSGRVGTPQLVYQLCGNPLDLECVHLLEVEVRGQALYYEGQALASLGVFRGLLQNLGRQPSRSMVVLLSAGTVASDIPGGRPNLSDLGTLVGKDATRSNVTVYTLFVDQSWIEQNSAETRSARNTLTEAARDSNVLGRWLDQFTGTAGGAMMKVMFGNGEYAFDRVLSETSAYYLLGVEPAAEDRDGRAHDLSVKVAAREATVRGRKWVVVPKPGAIKPAAPASAPAALPTAAPLVVAPPAPAPLKLLLPIVAAFERGDDQRVHETVVQSADPAPLIREFRLAGAVWPAAPRREAVLALEVGLAGLMSRAQDARDEAGRLLVQYAALIRQPAGSDVFECAWYSLQAAALPSLFQPAATLAFVKQAQQRCPNEPRLALTAAIITEQQWALQPLPVLPSDASAPLRPAAEAASSDAARNREVPPLYEAAMKFEATAAEARVRLAWFCFRTNQIGRARALLDEISTPPTDPRARYLAGLIRGQVLRAQGERDAAIAALRDAQAAVPGAPSARIALMTLLMTTGDRQEAESLALAVQSPSNRTFDPWWSYWLGDLDDYPTRLRRLRELAR